MNSIWSRRSGSRASASSCLSSSPEMNPDRSYHGDPSVGESAAVPRLEGQWFQLHYQPQQPDRVVSGILFEPPPQPVHQWLRSSMAAGVEVSVTRRAVRSITRIWSASRSPRWKASQTVGRPLASRRDRAGSARDRAGRAASPQAHRLPLRESVSRYGRLLAVLRFPRCDATLWDIGSSA